MTIAYIRPDKHFEGIHKQLQLINSYALTNNIHIDDEYIDQKSQDKKLTQRKDVSKYLKERPDSTLLLYDIWVLSTDIQDLVQMLCCLLKKGFHLHIIKQSLILSKSSPAVVILGVVNQLRQKIQNEAKKVIGRPKGSKSNSKFDKYTNKIISFIKEEKSVSEMARLLKVSRSSLKDYIESRELKQIAFSSLLPFPTKDAEEIVIDKINCPE